MKVTFKSIGLCLLIFICIVNIFVQLNISLMYITSDFASDLIRIPLFVIGYFFVPVLFCYLSYKGIRYSLNELKTE